MSSGRKSGKKHDRTNRKSLASAFWSDNHLIFVAAMVLNVLLYATNLFISVSLQEVVDINVGAGGAAGMAELQQIAIKIFIVILSILPLGYLYSNLRSRFIAKAMKQYKDEVTSRILTKGIGDMKNESSALYTSGLTNDCNIIENNYLAAMFDIVMMLFLFAGALILMISYSGTLTAIAIGLSLVPLVVSVMTGNKLAPLEADTSKRNENYVSIITEALAGFSVIKSFKAELRILEIISNDNKELETSKKRRNQLQQMLMIIGIVAGAIVQFGVFVIGAWLCIKGQALTPGILIVFVQLLNYIIQPIGKLPTAFANLKAARGLIANMEKSLDCAAREQQAATAVCTNNEAIRLKGVCCSYEEGNNVLDDLSFSFEKGKSYALVGASGCGKSTLLNLLMKGMDSYEGRVMFDDTELSDISTESLYDVVSVIQQNVFVFNATVRDNITMFGEFPENEIERVITLSGLSELVSAKGADYMCGEGGSGLSGGEKQRISIARALLRKSKVLLVDEATASLDSQTSNTVMNSILNLDDMTRIVITHDLDQTILARFDGILAIKNGNVYESGDFDSLMDKKGYFYSLYTVAQ